MLGLTLSVELAAATLNVPGDHSTIQKAIDAAKAGDTILVQAGTYHERVKLAPGVVLRSAGDDKPGKVGLARADATVLSGEGVEGKEPGVTMAAHAILDGFTITAFGKYDEQRWQQHHATQGDEQSHDHIGHFGSPGVGIVGVTCTVRNNVVHHNGDTGIGIRGSANETCTPLVEKNVCFRNMGGGIGSMKRSAAIIRGNTCYQNFFAGIGHDDASPLVIGNTCYENVRAGIGVSEGACPVVRGNKCYRNRRAGIGVRTGESTAPIVEDNECFENDMAGIGCEEHSAPIIRRNRCYRNAMAGIGSRTGAQPVIVSNVCYENSMAGIGTRDKARAVMVDNECRENKAAGIGVRADARAVICFNRCVENRLVAVGVPDGATALIHGNALVRTGGMPPLLAVRGGAKATISENQFRGGGVAAVLVEGEASIRGNKFQGRGPGQGSAVWVWAKSTATVSDNEVHDYRNAVQASQSTVVAHGNRVSGASRPIVVVKKPLRPAHVYGNLAISDDAAKTVVEVDEPRGVVAENRTIAERQ